MIILQTLIITTIIVSLIIWFIDWTAHIAMNKKDGYIYKWGTYKTFINKFNKYSDWIYQKEWPYSLFGNYYNMNYYIHANIIRLNGECLILYPISYLRFKLFMWNKCRKFRLSK